MGGKVYSSDCFPWWSQNPSGFHRVEMPQSQYLLKKEHEYFWFLCLLKSKQSEQGNEDTVVLVEVLVNPFSKFWPCQDKVKRVLETWHWWSDWRYPFEWCLWLLEKDSYRRCCLGWRKWTRDQKDCWLLWKEKLNIQNSEE